MTLLENFVTVSPFMHKMVSCFEDDFTLGITDTDRFIAYIPGKNLQFGISPHDPIKEGSLAKITMTQGKAVSKVMDSSVYGIAYIAGGIPIVEAGILTGTLVFGVSLDRQNKLAEIARHLSDVVEEVSARSMVMQHSAEELAAHSEKQYHVMTEMVRQVQTTFSVLQSITQIAKQSEVLGLNASIEAARAGEHGRGFTIVASEMRRLASMSGNLAKQISSDLSLLQNEIAAISEMVLGSKNLSRAQTEGIIELASAMQEVAQETILLHRMSQVILKT